MFSFLSKMGKKDPNAIKAALEFVQREIAAHPVVIFSKTYCPYCTQAKQALSAELGRGNYTVVELDRRSDGSEIQDALSTLTGARTVPRVFIGGKCIGGGTETSQMQRSGRLRQLLQSLGFV